MSTLRRWLSENLMVIVMSVVGLTLGMFFLFIITTFTTYKGAYRQAEIAGVELFAWSSIASLGIIIGAVVGKEGRSMATALRPGVKNGAVAGFILWIILAIVIFENYPRYRESGFVGGPLLLIFVFILSGIEGLIIGVGLGLIVGIIDAVIVSIENVVNKRKYVMGLMTISALILVSGYLYFIYTNQTKLPTGCPPNCSKADLREAYLGGAVLSGADLSMANLSGANLDGANLRKATLNFADLDGANLIKANLSGANLSFANLSGADLERTNLGEANLRGANLSGANLDGANLSGCRLQAANLNRAKIDEATQMDNKWRLVWEIVNQGAAGRELRGVDLSEANLSGANLSKADLTNAVLIGADLSGANLTGVTLWGADLTGTNLNFAKYNRLTKWPEGFDPATAGAILEE